jgi:hypothetical protein
MDWLNSLLTTAGNTYATVKNADNAPLLAQYNAQGQGYYQGQPQLMTQQGGQQEIPPMLLLIGAAILFIALKD